ncbi:hypothetical protein RI129_009277 [Pyrocoelia pectoralis]|uniref:Uncharacterized protein n=1 Tax=Pyrocoelia pectoralis TaxID=417401 RepID=A0AAN7ZBW6_9COLE
MTFTEKQNVKSIQAKLKLQLNELEDNLKYDWQNFRLDQKAKISIEDHLTEIVHHLDQIRYHLERVDHHKKRLDAIELQQKRSQESEEKFPFKLRRVNKTSSLKYVLQWENYLENQNSENVLSSVTFRNRKSSEAEFPITHTMVKNRIEEFEGIRKPKRTSSTIETFLDFSSEKPRRIKSYPIIEDTEGEQEIDLPYDTPKGCNEGDSENNQQKLETKLNNSAEVLNDNHEDHENGDHKSSDVELSKPRVVEIHEKVAHTIVAGVFFIQRKCISRSLPVHNCYYIDRNYDKDKDNGNVVLKIMENVSKTIYGMNEALIALHSEIRKVNGRMDEHRHTVICGLLLGNLVKLDNIKRSGNIREKREADVVINYLKYLKQLIDEKKTE